jgi:hypothetical protein
MKRPIASDPLPPSARGFLSTALTVWPIGPNHRLDLISLDAIAATRASMAMRLIVLGEL